MLEHQPQRIVEPAGRVILRRRGELVIEAIAVEELTQQRVVVRGEAVELFERVGHLGQRLAEMHAQHLLVRHIVRHLAQTVHIVRKGDQPGLLIRQGVEGVADHGGAQHFVERADMRQARRTIARLEQDRCTARLAIGIAFEELASFLIGPGLGLESGRAKFVCHGFASGKPGRDAQCILRFPPIAPRSCTELSTERTCSTWNRRDDPDWLSLPHPLPLAGGECLVERISAPHAVSPSRRREGFGEGSAPSYLLSQSHQILHPRCQPVPAPPNHDGDNTPPPRPSCQP